MNEQNHKPPMGVRPHEVAAPDRAEMHACPSCGAPPRDQARRPVSAVDRLARQALALLGDKAIAASAVREALEKALSRL